MSTKAIKVPQMNNNDLNKKLAECCDNTCFYWILQYIIQQCHFKQSEPGKRPRTATACERTRQSCVRRTLVLCSAVKLEAFLGNGENGWEWLLTTHQWNLKLWWGENAAFHCSYQYHLLKVFVLLLPFNLAMQLRYQTSYHLNSKIAPLKPGRQKPWQVGQRLSV